MTRPGCNLRACWNALVHRHTEEEEDVVTDGMWQCRHCEYTHEHDHWEIDNGRNAWEWECHTEGCTLRWKHQHPDETDAPNLCD